jgi:MoxR-like ATPase
MKVLEAMKATQSQVNGMDEAVMLAYASMISNIPCLFIGNPGTGKSHTFKIMAKQQGERDQDWFYQSITAKTSPEKLLGGIVADEMLKGIETYNLEVGASVKKGNIFDEIFKSQHPAMMNALLSYLDEDPTIFTGGKNIKPKYQWLMATTNFEDISHDLKYCPLWDRFGAKVIIKGLSNDESKQALKQALSSKKAKTDDNYQLTDSDLIEARTAASAIEISESCIVRFYEAVKGIIEKYCYLSQRKIHQIFVGKPGYPSLLQSIALLMNQSSISAKLLKFLPYFTWQDESILQPLLKEVDSVCINPIELVYLQIKEDYDRFYQNLLAGQYKSYATAQESFNVLNEGVARQIKGISKSDKEELPGQLRLDLVAIKNSITTKIDEMRLEQAPNADDDVPF